MAVDDVTMFSDTLDCDSGTAADVAGGVVLVPVDVTVAVVVVAVLETLMPSFWKRLCKALTLGISGTRPEVSTRATLDRPRSSPVETVLTSGIILGRTADMPTADILDIACNLGCCLRNACCKQIR